MPLVRRRILGETKGVVLPAEDPQFAAHAARRRVDGIGLLVNPLGESILGDDEAAPTRRPGVSTSCDGPTWQRFRSRHRHWSPTSTCSTSIAASSGSREPLAGDLPRRACAKTPHGFVNLDMEEYRDLELTVAAFTQVLDEPEFDQLEAGHRPAGVPARQPRACSNTSASGPPRAAAMAAPASRSASSRAPTWRWRRSKPSCTTGSPRRTRRRPTSTPATS